MRAALVGIVASVAAYYGVWVSTPVERVSPGADARGVGLAVAPAAAVYPPDRRGRSTEPGAAPRAEPPREVDARPVALGQGPSQVARPQRQPAVPSASRSPSSPGGESSGLVLPPEVQAALGDIADLQKSAHDPQSLADRVQKLEPSQQRLEKLRAFADTFVKMPPGEKGLGSLSERLGEAAAAAE